MTFRKNQQQMQKLHWKNYRQNPKRKIQNSQRIIGQIIYIELKDEYKDIQYINIKKP